MPVELRYVPISGQDAALAATLTAAGLPIDDIGEDGRRFFRFDDNGKVVGYGGFEPHGDHALVRSIVVAPALVGQGYGRSIAEAVMREAGKAGARQAFLLTTSAEAFFRHLGFAALDRADAPLAILNTRQATSICSSATLLARRLDD